MIESILVLMLIVLAIYVQNEHQRNPATKRREAEEARELVERRIAKLKAQGKYKTLAQVSAEGKARQFQRARMGLPIEE